MKPADEYAVDFLERSKDRAMADTTNNKILRIGVIRGGQIVDEKLVPERIPVTVGTDPGNTFVLASTHAPRSVVLFDLRANDYYLSFTENMNGRISVGDRSADLQSLRAQNLVSKVKESYYLKLNESARGRISVGDCIVLFQFVSPQPEPSPTQLPTIARGYWLRNIDWPYSIILGSTLFVMFVIWIIASLVPVPEQEMSINDIPDRFAKMIMPDRKLEQLDDGRGAGLMQEMDRPKKKKKKKPKKEEPTVGGEEKDGGKKAKPAALTAAERRANIEKKVAGRGLLKILGAKGQVEGAAMGGAVADVFESGGIGDSGDGAFEGVSGLDVASLPGEKGSRGMGGVAKAANIERMGTKGVVGGAGRKTRGKSEARVVAKVSSAALQEFDSDSRNQRDIVKVIRRRLGGIKHCYEKRLKRNPELKGKIVIRFVVHPGGRVIDVEVVENTTGDSSLGECIAGLVQAVRFPPADGGDTVVIYTFILAPGE